MFVIYKFRRLRDEYSRKTTETLLLFPVNNIFITPTALKMRKNNLTFMRMYDDVRVKILTNVFDYRHI